MVRFCNWQNKLSRTGIEDKLPWKKLPVALRQQVSNTLGSPVVRAMRVWGGYSPTPTFRLALVDGRRAFFKGTYKESYEFPKIALLYEEKVYQELTPILGSFMPKFYATLRYEDWHCLLLEDVGPQSVPPWTTQKCCAITHSLADFHKLSQGQNPPAWLSRPTERLQHEDWQRTARESQDFQQIAALAGAESAQALEWFHYISPTIQQLMAQPILKKEPLAILHGDLRSDNLRLRGKQLYLFDWSAITVGRPEWDLVAFAQTVEIEGGPMPEQIISWYGEKAPLDSAAIDSSLAWWLTFFAEKAWRPEIPGLPRLRRFQRQQLGTIILWICRRWSLPEPDWARKFLV